MFDFIKRVRKGVLALIGMMSVIFQVLLLDHMRLKLCRGDGGGESDKSGDFQDLKMKCGG